MDEPLVTEEKSADRVTVILRWVVGLVVALILAGGAWLGFAYATTPAALRHPTQAHYHFRLQVINNGQAVNFADDKFQVAFNADICSAALTQQPLHFHDKLDQFIHVHWNHLTGGIVLKDYGWNLIGGPNGTLGYRFDKFPQVIRVPIHGQNLPARVADVHYYVYTGDQDSYRQRDWKDFLNTDLQTFFGDTQKVSWLDQLVPGADAADDEKLTQLNHVLGNVVIFAQKTPPTDEQIKARFNYLVPLPLSACGG